MGLFDKLFGNNKKIEKEAQKTHKFFRMINGYVPVFTSYEGGIYESALCRAAIHATAQHRAKLKLELIGSARPDLKNKLLYKPNEFMNTYQFLYRLSTILSVCNTAFIVPVENEFGLLIGYYPLLPDSCTVVSVNDVPYLKYEFSNGQKAAIEYSKVGVLTDYQFRNDFFGENNRKVLQPTMELINTQNQGIIEGVKNSVAIRFMAQMDNFSTAEDIKEARKELLETNMTDDNNGGIMLFGNQYSNIQAIKSEPFVINAPQQKLINESVYNYFGVNNKILNNSYDENIWNGFYEGKIETFALQTSLAMTNMTFTEHQRGFGNEIRATANRLQYASNATKLQVSTQLFDRGLINKNQAMEIWNLPPVDGGDKYYIRKEYAEMSQLGYAEGEV